MEFKKNWHKITAAVLLFIGAIFYFLPLLSIPAGSKFPYVCMLLAGLVFFLGSATYTLCKMLDPQLSKWVLLSIGILGTVLMLINFIALLVSIESGMGFGLYYHGLGEGLTPAITGLLIFGLLPLVKGIKKVVCCKGCCEHKHETHSHAETPKHEPEPVAVVTEEPRKTRKPRTP